MLSREISWVRGLKTRMSGTFNDMRLRVDRPYERYT